MKSIAKKIFCSAVRFTNVPVFCLTLALLPVLLLTACDEVPAAGLVDLKSESELRQIAQEECPPSTFVRMEWQRNKNICHFTDNACGFAFTISSFASESTFEGLKIGYLEHTTNTWDQCYYDYVMDTIKPEADAIASQYGFTIEKLDRTPIRPFVYLHTDRTLEQIADGMVRLGRLVKRVDVHHKYDKCELWAKHYSSEKGFWDEFAFYRFKDDVTDDFDRYDIYDYMDNAEEQLGVKCIFERKTQMKGSEIPGLSSHEYYDADDENRLMDVYFFHTETGEKKLIANFQVAQNVFYVADAE